MSTWPRMRKVTRDEFYAFTKAYPRKLEPNVCSAGEPPLVTLNDFSRAPQWPESVVASYFGDGGYDMTLGPHNWRILDDEKAEP